MAAKKSIPQPKTFRPNPKGKARLIGLLFVFFIIIGAVIFFKSNLAKIQTIEVEGALITSKVNVMQQARLANGDSFFAFRSGAIVERINAIPGVHTSRVERDFPGKIILHVQEYKLAGYQLNKGTTELVLENGTKLPMTDLAGWVDRPVLSNWEGHAKLEQTLCKVLANLSDVEVADLSEIMPMPSAAYPDKIKIYTRSSFEVITTISKLKGKLPYLANIVSELIDKGQTTGRITMLEANTSQSFK
jgi:cell division protein FtsQ